MAQPKGKLTYYCPYCNQKLSFFDGTIVKLAGRLHAEHFTCKTMIYVSGKLGQYGGIVGEGVRVREGARMEFECTNGACKANFTTSYDDNLAEIKLIDGEGREFAVIFNKIYGKRSTFIVDVKEKTLSKKYGQDAQEFQPDFDKPLNFFGH